MKVTGIIAEYNPFHNGHAYHLAMSRECTGADCLVVLLSGHFVQRGEPAIYSPYLRAKAALLSGADLVIALPAVYSSASAEGFADGALSLMGALGGISTLSFGSESADSEKIIRLGHFLAEESEEYRTLYKEALKDGASSPSAREKAVKQLLGMEYSKLLTLPNNILAVEYIKAIERNRLSIEPVAILRQGAAYHDDYGTGEYAGAEFLRKSYAQSGSIDSWSRYMQDSSYALCQSAADGPVLLSDCSSLLDYALSKTTDLAEIADITPDLAGRIRNSFIQEPVLTFAERIEDIKSRNYTYTRISRALLHILLGITKEDAAHPPYYARVLGMNDIGREYLHAIKKTASVPIITEMSDAKRMLSEDGMRQLSIDIGAANIYNSIIYNKTHVKLPDEYHRSLIYIR